MASTLPASTINYTTSDETRNISWVQQAFLLTNENASNPDIDEDGLLQRLYTTAAFCYSDTSPGGNWAINPAPQFCRYADVTMGGSRERVEGGHSSSRTTMYTEGSFGEGRYYNEIIEGNAQYVTMCFGIPAFNSLTTFFGNFYNANLGTLVRTGRLTPSLFQKAGQLAGSLLALPFRPLVWVSQVIKNASGIPSTSYAYFRPAMTLYWQAVTTMVNSITVNLGIHERDISAGQRIAYSDPNFNTSGSGATQDIQGDITRLHEYLPKIYSAWPDSGTAGQRGGIDVYALASRSQALSYAFEKKIQAALDNSNSVQDLRANIKAVIGTPTSPTSITGIKASTMSEAMTKYINSAHGQANIAKDADGVSSMSTDIDMTSSTLVPPAKTGGETQPTTPAPSDASSSAPTPSPSIIAMVENWFKEMSAGLVSDLQDGSQYVTFKVDYGGAIGESFGNSFRPSDVEEQINSKVSSARTAAYNLAGGNLVGGAVGTLMQSIGRSVTETVTGVLQGMNLQGLNVLAGAAYVDIPRMFDSSSTNMPTQTFTIHLRSPYGHKLALLQNLYIPLALLLAGCLPRATGPASYSTPFVCQLFAKGRMQARYGMITSLSVQRGTGNIGFTKEGLPLGIDISFEVTDFSSVLYMPIIAQTGFLDKMTMAVSEGTGKAVGAAAAALGANTTSSQGAATGETIGAALTVGMYSDDSIFSDYMAILGGLTFQDQVYTFRKWSIALEKTKLDYEMAKSPYHWALMVNGSLPGRIISGLVRGTDRGS